MFVAPTVRKSKVTGELVAYRWTRPPDPIQLRGLAGDKSGAKLAELVRSWSGTRAAGGAGFTQPSTWWGDNRGPIPMGERHDKLVSYAGKLRDIGLPIAEAEMPCSAGWRTASNRPPRRTRSPGKKRSASSTTFTAGTQPVSPFPRRTRDRWTRRTPGPTTWPPSRRSPPGSPP